MRHLFRLLVLCLAPALAAPAQAEREVHVVAVGRGLQPDDFLALPEAQVLVDRPGQEVGLVLLDGGDVRWRIEATPDTAITEIILGGRNPDRSEVLLSGIPMSGAQVQGLPLVFHPRGIRFRSLIDTLSERMNTGRIHSFQGAHFAYDRVLRIDRVDTETPELTRDYLAQALGRDDDLPAALRDWLETGPQDDQTVTFDPTGVTLTGTDGTRHFPPPGDVPRVLLPVSGVLDAGSGTIYALSLGAEGYIYAIDTGTGDWSVVTGLDGYDAAALMYDADGMQWILTGAFSRPGEIEVYGRDGSRFSTFIPVTSFPGLPDLFNFGNEHGPPLTPRVIADGWLLLEALGRGASRYPEAGPYRIYALHLDTGEVRLLRYRDE